MKLIQKPAGHSLKIKYAVFFWIVFCNLIVQALEKDELVDFCIVTNAATEETLRSSSLSGSTTERVTAKITVYLNSGMGEVK